jgi:Ino eighty subunit 1
LNRNPPLHPKAAQPDPRKPNLTDRIIPTFRSTESTILNSLSNADIRSIYVFAKTPQIKKPDGKPLLRKDIQFALLSYIFHNDKAVFTSSYDAASPKMTFSELYIDSMARSSKCSRVVREKLQIDTDLAISVAMVSLLVNVGKMNTTLTCIFPP